MFLVKMYKDDGYCEELIFENTYDSFTDSHVTNIYNSDLVLIASIEAIYFAEHAYRWCVKNRKKLLGFGKGDGRRTEVYKLVYEKGASIQSLYEEQGEDERGDV